MTKKNFVRLLKQAGWKTYTKEAEYHSLFLGSDYPVFAYKHGFEVSGSTRVYEYSMANLMIFVGAVKSMHLMRVV